MKQTHLPVVVVISVLLFMGLFWGGTYAIKRALNVWHEQSSRSDQSLRQWETILNACKSILRADSTDVQAALRAGDILQRIGYHEESAEMYAHALRHMPEDPKLWEQAGDQIWHLIQVEIDSRSNLLYAQRIKWPPPDSMLWGQAECWFEMVITAYDAVLRIDPSQTALYEKFIDHCKYFRREDEIIRLYRAAQQALPHESWPWSKYGYYLSGFSDRKHKALAAIDTALMIDSANWNTWGIKAGVLGELGRIDDALAARYKALAFNKSDPSGRSVQRRLIAELLLQAGRLQESEEMYEYLTATDRRNSWGWYGLACVRSDLERPLSDILAPLDSTISRSELPERIHIDAYLMKGEILLKHERPDEALAAFQTITRLDSGSLNERMLPEIGTAWIQQGRILHDRGQENEALSCLERGTVRDPDNAEGWKLKAEVLNGLGQHQEASELTTKTQRIEDQQSINRQFMENVRKSSRVRDSVYASLPTLVSWSDTIKVTRITNLLTTRETVVHEAERYQEWAVAIKESPANREEWWTNAQILEWGGRLTEADDAYSKAIELDPQEPWGWYCRASVRARLDQFDSAIADVAAALKLSPDLRSWAAVDPKLHNLWDNPRFEVLVASERSQ
ncbi:MAG: TPR end-of-group domain-containing protein [Calditrichota bacterium]